MQFALDVVQVRLPHAGRIAKVAAVAAGLVVPSVRPVRAVAEVPAPPWSREFIKGEQMHVRVLATREYFVEHVVLPVDVEILDRRACAVLVGALVALLPLAGRPEKGWDSNRRTPPERLEGAGRDAALRQGSGRRSWRCGSRAQHAGAALVSFLEMLGASLAEEDGVTRAARVRLKLRESRVQFPRVAATRASDTVLSIESAGRSWA